MLVQVLKTLAGVLGLAAIVSTAPAISYGPGNICVDPSIVYVTVTAHPSTVYLTVNPHDPSSATSTVYITSYAAITNTRTKVVTTVSSGAGVHVGQTITPQEYVTVTEHLSHPIANTATASSDGTFNFIVVNGTTSWIGATPTFDPSGSFVLATSSITVEPVLDPTFSSSFALDTTSYLTKSVTSTSTISIANSPTPVSQGTGLVYTGTKSGGWNMSSTVTGIYPSVGCTGLVSVSHSTFDIYGSNPTVSLTSYSAQSGLDPYTHAIPSGLITSTAQGEVSPKSTSCTSKSSIYSAAPPLYTNSTSASATGFATGTAEGVIVSSGSVHSTGHSSIHSTIVNSTSITATNTVWGTDPSSTVHSPTGFNSTHPTDSVPSATSSTSGLLPLGAACTSSSQCANGAQCYATNSMLHTVCGNFQAPCTSDSQCAFNTCVSGFCNGPKSLSATGQPLTSTKPANLTTLAPPMYVLPTSISSSPTSSSSTTTISTSSTATPTKCGLQGDFTLSFDDLPPLAADNPDTVDPMPLFNPYHQFGFSSGFTVVPPPTVPYVPSSKPLLLEFIPFFNTEGNNTQAGPDTPLLGSTGEISDGDNGITGCFAFNLYGASFGCNSTGPDCDFTFTGYTFNVSSKVGTLIATQNYAIAACPSLTNCPLTPIELDNTFQELTYIRIKAEVAKEQVVWWMDDLKLGWFNNTCAAGLCRLNTHIHKFKI